MPEKIFDVKLRPPVMFLFPLLAGILLHFFFSPLRIFSDNFSNNLIAVPLLAVGFILNFWAKKTLKAHGVHPRFQSVKKLVSSGPYYYTRNPLYISVLLFYLGFSFAFNSFWPIILIPLPVAFLYWRVILMEEAYLESEFGKEYVEYRKKVRRWI